ncbi:MAG: polysaccharide deacetylase family protein [Acidobacteriota bacterium]
MTSNQSIISKEMQIVLAIVITIAASITLYMRLKKTTPPLSPMAVCLDEMAHIPEIGGLMKSQAREEAVDSQPLQGVELALTFNGMIRSKSLEDDIDYWCADEDRVENLDHLIRALNENQIPPTVDFVVGQSLDGSMVEHWLQSGNLIGNMTYSRLKAKNRDPQEFIADVNLNDQTLQPFLDKHPSGQKYFRYPRLKVSRDQQARGQIQEYLKSKGYIEAMATIDMPDNQFSNIYCAAKARGDETCARLVKENYKMLLLDKTLKTRKAARQRTGYEVKLIVTFAMSQLTCDFMGEILNWYKSLGVKFITLDEALRDPLYSTLDEKGRPIARAILRETRRMQVESMNAK